MADARRAAGKPAAPPAAAAAPAKPAAAPRPPLIGRPHAAPLPDAPAESPDPGPGTVRPRPVLELVTLVGGIVGVAFTVVGAIGLNLPLGDTPLLALGIVLGVGLLSTGISVAASHGLDRLHRYGAAPSGSHYEQVRLATRQRITALMLGVLVPLAILVEVVALLSRGSILRLPFGHEVLSRGALGLAAILAAVQAATAWVSLRTVPRRRENAALFMGLSTSLVGVLGLAVLVLAVRGSVTGPDLPIAALGAATAAAIGLGASRGLPTLASVLGSDRALGGGPIMSRNRAVFLPVLASFALLMLVFLLFVLLGIGVLGSFSELARDPAVVGVVLFLLLALGFSLAAAFRLAKSEPLEPPLFQAKSDAKKVREAILLAASGVACLLLFVPALVLYSGTSFLGMPSSSWIHFFALGLLAAIGPYGFYAAGEQRRIRLLEERFPDFLRDIASSHKGGLTLASSLTVAAKGDYGPLTPEVQKMADQVAWNVGFQEVLTRFAESVRTPLVQRAVTLILQADRSGGRTTEVLMAAARDAREIKTLETERRLAMSLYTVVIYVTFLVFLGVAAVLYAQFVPQLVAASQAAAAQTNLGSFGAAGGTALRLQDFQLFYLLSAVMQGLGDGILAGQMGSGKAVLGLRHAFVMVLLSYVCFALFLT